MFETKRADDMPRLSSPPSASPSDEARRLDAPAERDRDLLLQVPRRVVRQGHQVRVRSPLQGDLRTFEFILVIFRYIHLVVSLFYLWW